MQLHDWLCIIDIEIISRSLTAEFPLMPSPISAQQRRPSPRKKWPSTRLAKGLLGALSAAAIALLIITQTSPPAAATDYSQIYVFGDSLSDTGNAFASTGIPPAPYFKGHFSNGPIWAEYLAADLGIPETNLAYGGARSGESGVLQVGGSPATSVPGAITQTRTFVASTPTADPNALYLIWVGANDYLSGQRNPSATIDNIRQSVSILSQAGAKNFLLVNLPPLGNLPLLQTSGAQPAIANALNNLSAVHNQALAEMVAATNNKDGLKVELLDVYSLYESAIVGNLAISDTTDICISTPACVNRPAAQNAYLFWDSIHPTTATHPIIANNALSVIEAQ